MIWRDSAYTLVECPVCSFRSVIDPPRQQTLNRLYSRDYFERFYIANEAAKIDGFRDLIVTKMPRPVSGDRLLDIGCGPGFLLVAAREAGWQVHGIDSAQYAAEYASTRFGLDVTIGEIEDIEMEGLFRVATMWDVLAHIRDPLSALRRAHEMIQPGGSLFVRTPYRTKRMFSVARQISFLPKARTLLHIPAQLNHFNPKSLASMMDSAGFSIHDIEEHRHDSLRPKLRLNPKYFLIGGAEGLFRRFGWSNSMTVHAIAR